MSTPLAPFKERLKHALASPNLELALERALTQFRERRAAAFAPGEFETLRADLHRRKDAALEQLPELVQQFKAQAEAVGAVVHFAADAEEACSIVGRLAQERGAHLVVKSKSMATEEIGLNPYLEEQGIRVVETDLGEWIIQLGDDHPSHLIAPAIHWTREEVAELFSEVTGEHQEPDIKQLVKVARRKLRQEFIDADMGITGANIGIAESGTLVIVTNEGNADLVTTLPPIHVAILGVEKIVPSLDDAVAILKLLPRSATGQRLSSYTQFITGPSRTGDIELSMTTGVHGPEEVHIILVDNGRWALRDDPEFSDTLRCIRCAACSNVCPAYQAVGGQAMGHIYTGPIGIILTAQHHGIDAAAGPQSLCTSCNACAAVCPVEIPIPQLILGVRQRYVAEAGLPWAKRAALDLFADRAAFERAFGLAKVFQWPFRRPASSGAASGAGLRLPFLSGFRSLPSLPRQGLYARMKHRLPHGMDPRLRGSSAQGKTVALFGGCITNLVYPEMGEAIADVLEGLGVRVSFPQEQWCCGLAHLNAGDRTGAKPLAKQTIETFERVEADYILSGSSSCVAAIQQDYLDLFRDEPEWLARAQAVGRRLVDFTSFMERALPQGGTSPLSLSPQATRRGESLSKDERSVTYHDACQSCNSLGLHDEARRVLREVLGVQVSEMVESSVCCGFGGSFSFDQPAVAERILRRKLNNADATGAGTIVTDNPGCIMHLRGGLDAAGKQVRVLHLAEALAQALGLR